MKPRKLTFGLLAIVLVFTADAAFAGPKFAAYEGRDAVQEGQGGTKIAKDGVDFWTTGTPPHRFQVLGVLTDERGSGLFSGDAIGSPGVVHKVRELGGDGVVFLGTESQVRGAMIISGNLAVARTRTTQLLVIKYLDAAPAAPPTANGRP